MNRRVFADLAPAHVLHEPRGWWSVIAPEGTTNLIANPSFEIGTTGWGGNVGGETVARSTTRSTRGVASLSFTPVAANASSATYSVTLAANTIYTLSCDVYGMVGVPLAITLYDDTVGTTLAYTRFTGANRWQHIVLTARTGPNTAHKILIGKYNGSPISASTAVLFIDGVQVEAKAYETTYVDGDLLDCAWRGSPHASASYRVEYTRSGGRVVPLSDYSFTVSSIIGAHAGPYANIAIPNAQVGGAMFQQSIPQPRQFSIVGRFEAQSLVSLHRAQQGLLDVLKPDRYQQPVRLIYQPLDCQDELGKALLIDAVYTSGLEGNLVDEANEDAAITFTTYAPAAIGKTMIDSASAVGLPAAVANANYILQRDALGFWGALGTGANGSVFALVTGPDKCLYAGGSFALMSGIANTARIAKWDSVAGAWSALSTGADDTVSALAFGPDGILYAGGSFHNIGGVACAHIAKWNGAAWSALNGGANDVVYTLCIGSNGHLYAGGVFTLMDGIANTAYIAQWNPDTATWTPLGTGANGQVNSIVASSASIYAGGLFTLMGGVADTVRLAKWDSTWHPLSTGADNNVTSLALGIDGTLYAGGAFTIIGGKFISFIARWNGSEWNSLGAGVGNTVFSMAVDIVGTLHVGGVFPTAGGITLSDHFAQWNGSTWLLPDVDLPGAAIIYSILPYRGTLTLGYDQAGAAVAANGIASITNSGTLDVYPTLMLTGPGKVDALRNFTTGDAIYFNLTLLAGERAILRMGPRLELLKSSDQNKPFFYSTFRDNLIPTILPGSNPATWKLTPGANSVSLYWSGTTAASQASIIFRPAFDSIAGAVL